MRKPPTLSVVGTLPAGLEIQPLVAQMALVQGVVGETVLGVVHLGYVLVDGAGFPEGEPRVGVLDGGGAAVAVDVGEGLLFDVVEADGVDFVV